MKGTRGKPTRQEQLAKIFRMAIRAEQRAQRMYQDALVFCEDEDLRAILVGLYEDERRHEKEMAEMYRELRAFLAAKEKVEERARAKPARKAPARKGAKNVLGKARS